jgi:hypothetical protein
MTINNVLRKQLKAVTLFQVDKQNYSLRCVFTEGVKGGTGSLHRQSFKYLEQREAEGGIFAH